MEFPRSWSLGVPMVGERDEEKEEGDGKETDRMDKL